MRRKLLLTSVVVLLALGAVAAGLRFFMEMVEKRTTRHIFELVTAPRFLTEEQVIAVARKALALEGFDEAAWELQEDDRTADPDGRKDEYVARNSLNPNRVTMMFLNKAEKEARIVGVELEAKQLVCEVTIPK